MATKFKREFKNVVYNYSDAEAKVREATSNDPWGPSSAVMSDLADFTYHIQAYSLVMGMLWKRLNDHGKNWRHVYKSLTVLEYLIKAGSERVAQQCKDNIFSIQTLKDFQYLDKDGKDQGGNVREKAKQLVSLLKDDNKLKDERQRARLARERQIAIGSDSPAPPKKTVTSDEMSPTPAGNGKRVQPVEQAIPGNESEEEMQLKLAIQLSKQQAEEEDKIRKQEEESLTAALALSAADLDDDTKQEEEQGRPSQGPELLLDFNGTGVKDPWSAQPAELLPTYDSVVGGPDLWGVGGTSNTHTAILTTVSADFGSDPFGSWGGSVASTTKSAPSKMEQSLPPNDPWSISVPQPSSFSSTTEPSAPFNPFSMSDLGVSLATTSATPQQPQPVPKVEAKFLGNNADLVDLDLLAPGPAPPHQTSPVPSRANPFGLPLPNSSGASVQKPLNPFDSSKPLAPTLSQLAVNNGGGFADPLPAPLIPIGAPGMPNDPFLPPTQTAPNTQVFNPFS